MASGGELIVACLRAQGVSRAFCVPGESYLPVLDALHDADIDLVTARHEGGAAMMAEADGKLTGRPGVCLVTRGPGATNAAAGVHVARQDSTPMVLLVGLIARGMRGRDAFQEFDLRQTFGDLAKWADVIDDADRIPEMMSRAWHVAMNGRPGPVVLGLPEDVLTDTAEVEPGPRVEPADPAPTPADVERATQILAAAERPFLLLGGSRWTGEAVAAAQRFAERWDLPVGCSFRRQHLFDQLHANYAGDVGLGINPALAERVATSDLVVLLGARFSENPSQGFSLFGIPKPDQALIHVHPGPEELGRIYAPDLAINAAPGAFLAAMEEASPAPAPLGRAAAAHAAYLRWRDLPGGSPGVERMALILAHLAEAAPDAVMTNGAGNYAIWLHRFWRYGGFGRQLAPTSGSMGYGLPAAIAAKLRDPAREVICWAGDGCFQMTCQEFATAVQTGAAIIVLVFDNGMHGTIRMHQEKTYPGRVVATTLANPDFAAYARACGGRGETVVDGQDFAAAFTHARASGLPTIIHIKIDPDTITPNTTLTALRENAMRRRSSP